MKRFAPSAAVACIFLCIFMSIAASAAEPTGAKTLGVPAEPPDSWIDEDAIPIDLVICLDLSGSMDKLLEQVRLRLWDIADELGGLEPPPALRIGLITFGDRTVPNQGFVARRFDLTSDLDYVHARLSELENTRAGLEFVGRALNVAVESMDWSEDADALRMIVVAGNEPADQGSETFDFRAQAAEARARDIVVNTLYAGKASLGIEEGWKELADLGAGRFLALKSPGVLRAVVAAPQDAELARLNAELNATYLPIGESGAKRLALQAEQDARAVKLGALADRVSVKAGRLYENGSWDLLDAARRPGFDRSTWRDADLPPAFRGLEDAEFEALLAEKARAREALQLRIRALADERAATLRAGPGGEATDPVRSVVTGQAEERGFRKRGS